nr:OmpA family protein [Pseudenhygromyxa sp. WMMC2535]
MALAPAVAGAGQPAEQREAAEVSATPADEPTGQLDARAPESGDDWETRREEGGWEAPEEGPAESDARQTGERKDIPWIRRWAPEANTGEIGIYGGVLLLSADHELFEPDLDQDDQGFRPLRRVNPDLGLRIGYYPLRFFGLEAEGGVAPSRVDDGQGVMPFMVRGQVVGQLGLWSVTPFVLVGGGLIGVRSAREALGDDVDPALHFGGGVKFYLDRWVSLRLDVRDVVSNRRGVEQTFEAHNLEALLSLSIVLGRSRAQRKSTPPPPDEPRDSDGDGIFDDVDQCVDDPETVNGFEDEDGCPEQDRDGDGFWDAQDACPDEAGVEPDGCPIRDTDGDGIFDDVDQCVEEPETENGFEDADGCPDALPEAVERFNGSIKGITFETNEAIIKRSSLPALDEAVRTLTKYPDVRIEISGHTDSKGARDHNMDLSRRRAESVASYLIGMGVAEDRITTVGYGPDVPVDSNATREGRANNRRIEFRVLKGAEARGGSEPAPAVEPAGTAAEGEVSVGAQGSEAGE